MAEQRALGGRVTPPAAPSNMRLQDPPSKSSMESRDRTADRGLRPKETVPALRRSRRSASNLPPAEAVLYAGQITRSAASSVIRRESEMLRLQCSMFQRRRHRSTSASEASSASDLSMPLHGLHSTVATAHSHSLSSDGRPSNIAIMEPDATRLWLRACRTKRMALLLRELEITHQLLADELRRVEAAEDDNRQL